MRVHYGVEEPLCGSNTHNGAKEYMVKTTRVNRVTCKRCLGVLAADVRKRQEEVKHMASGGII